MAPPHLDITRSCADLVSHVQATKKAAQEASRRNREVRPDFGDLSRQLSDLSDVLDLWQYDTEQNTGAKDAVASVVTRLSRLLEHCEEILQDIDGFIRDTQGLVSWTDELKVEMDGIYKLLDAYTLSLHVCLDMLNL